MSEIMLATTVGDLIVEMRNLEKEVEVSLRLKSERRCLLHWGLSEHVGGPWQIPPVSIWPEDTKVFGDGAVQSPFASVNGEGRIEIKLHPPLDLPVISFVLFFPEENRWDNNKGKNYYIHLFPRKGPSLEDPVFSGMADEIIEHEMGHHSWTLMHRFNLCYDLLDRVKNNVEGLALIFVWLRFSAIRQLDWQRNYNTKPRELSHAMDRLTQKLSEIYITGPPNREFIRLMMPTLGRGSEGQRIRDEILEIMHRHHIKEVSGHFTEEWHQKMHNNTTPDDIVICGAYLEFLRSNGDLPLFYKTLEAGGVTKERLESFERPITTPPDFVPHLKDGLIHDFEHFLGTLKAVHSGSDLGIAIQAARYLFNPEVHGLMDFIWAHREGPASQVSMLVQKVTESRRRLKERLNGGQGVRDLLFLDIALENFLRVVVERNIHTHLSVDQLVELISLVLENWLLSHDDPEIENCLHEWKRLKERPRLGRERSLHAQAVNDRLVRVVSDFIDRYHQLLQPKAESLGKAFHADPWTIDLFSEEVARGSPPFVLSILLHHLNPILRKAAQLGNWQVISPRQGTGWVEVVDTLNSVQGERFDRPAVIITEKVKGDEEIPQGVIGVVTTDAVDIVSHVAIRARNARILFATCYDPETINRLKSLKGHLLHLSLSASGEVRFEETGDVEGLSRSLSEFEQRTVELVARPCFTVYALSSRDFNKERVGGKSLNLTRLMGKLPPWIHLPLSVALPFGVFEEVMGERRNSEILHRYDDLLCRVDDQPELLPDLRKKILALEPPDELIPSLRKVMKDAGLEWPEGGGTEDREPQHRGPEDRANVWMCIKRVWASKWNERAYLSRKAMGIPHENLFMAVLIQPVVEADYAFVIHTVNPFSGNRDELYGEVVLGLGETLVGNYPGRALSFTFPKGGLEPRLLAYPSKSVALYGRGLIFRSDSNGEDLAGYAGAGLYDSIMLEPFRKVLLDYANEPVVWDEDFRRALLAKMAEIGLLIEKVMGLPQDIEGACAKGQYHVVQTRPQVGVVDD